MKMRNLLLFALLAVPADVALAGGGPETTLVVVNARSPLSRQIANEYVVMRDIPANHVVWLEGIPHLGVVPLGFFKEMIWAPIRAHMVKEGIESEIDLITYSADFPYGVDFRSELDRPGQPVGGQASLTGVTYLARHVMAGDPFWDLGINRYYRVPTGGGPGMKPLTAREKAVEARANSALQQKDYGAAARAFEKLFSTHEGSNSHWYNYACCLALLGKAEKALDALEKAAEKGFANGRHAAQDADLVSLRKNPRFKVVLGRMRARPMIFQPAHGFSSAYAWKGEAEPDRDASDGKDRYYLSTQLAYTGPKGNSRAEILGYLLAAASADGTRPDGTVYVCRNNDVRSTSREPFFPSLLAGLKALGRKAAILEKGVDGQDGVLPIGKDDVIGAVVGKAGFSWSKSKSRILPGAICEHLTSFGAHFGTPGQTKLTEFLRFGAAGASGTVMEPLSIHMKFPNPMIHVYYAEGCSLAEAFYQSVFGPYQLMIVGDGLARPFADLAEVSADAPPSPWRGSVEITPRGEGGRFELWVDGRRVGEGESFTLDTTKLDDGYHDVRVVRVAADRIETRSYTKLRASVSNHDHTADLELVTGKVVLGEPVVITARGAKEIQALHGSRVVAKAAGRRLTIPTDLLGPGPVTLIPRLVFPDGSALRGDPMEIEVLDPPAAASRPSEGPPKPGLRGTAVTRGGERTVVVTHLGDKRSGLPLRDQLKGLSGIKKLTLLGEIEAPHQGTFQLAAVGRGRLSVAVGDRTLCTEAELSSQLYLPVTLGKGWHPIRLVLEPEGAASLELFMGGDQVFAPLSLRHASLPALSKQPEIAGAVEGKPTVVPKDGLVLDFKRTARNIAGVTLFPVAKAKGFPGKWVVEYATSGKSFKPVKDLEILVGKGPKGVPLFLEMTFKPTRARKLRLRPEGGGEARLSKVDVLGKRKR